MLLIISAKVAHSLWRYFSFSAEYTAVSPSANKPPRADAKTFDKNDVQLISQQNWFGKYQPVAAPVKQPEPVPVAETRLNVVLRGIAFGARPGAVIEEGGKQQVYLQGERLGSHNAVIEEINRDHVMLRYQGKMERLSLAEEKRPTIAVTSKKAVSDEAKQAVAEPAVSAPVEIPAAVRQALAKDPQKIFNYIQLTPVRKEGIVGYAVKPGADRSLFDASGFKEGDIAIALNQQDFTDPRAMIALMRQLPSMDSIQLTVLRKGAALRHFHRAALTAFNPGESFIVFWRDMTLSVWRKKTTGLKTKKRLLPLVLAAALCSSPVWAEEATFTANFKDTDLKSFIETVGANLNKTIIMGPGVQGKVSIRTMTPLNERQYYQLFLNLLEAQGYAVVPMENDVLKVVKSSAAKVEPLPLVGEGSDNYAGDEMVTKVVPVRNVSVRELAPILRQMIDSAGSGNVVNYDPSNVIMLTGRASVVERLTEVIQRVDHAGNRTEEVIPLDNASASEIARVLESLTKNSGENQPATLKSQIVADERTNSVIVSGDPATRDKMRRLIRRLDSEMERSGNSQVFYLKYSKAEDLVDVLKQVSGTLTAAKEEAEGTVGSGREVVSIAASKHSNALIVTAPQDIMQSLQSVIEQLDIRRAQVHVEALIVEVAEGSNINFGVQWASKDAGLMQFANGTQIPIGTLGAAISQAKPQKGSTVISENGATTINPDTNGDLSTLAQLLSGFSGTAVGVVKGDWMALVQAVKNDSSSNVLSTPSITTLDNQEAFFMVGQDVPVLTGSTVGSNNSNPFNTVERKKVGIMLKVTPQINEGNAVQMVIEQEVSKVEGQTSLDVVFGERKLKTTVLANDGELIVLGGLMDDQAGESVAKVPLLGDIPLIGNLFKSTADKKEKRNLMVFIRPTILRDGMAADGVSQRKYNYMRAEQIYRDEQGLSLMPHTAQPVLPAQNQALPPEVRAFLNAGRTR